MGLSSSSQKSESVEELSKLVVFCRTETNSLNSQKKLLSGIGKLKKDLQNPKLKKAVLEELKGVKAMPSVVSCANWQKEVSSQEELSEVQIEAIDLLLVIISEDFSFAYYIFQHNLIGVINKIALSDIPEYRLKGVRILSYILGQTDKKIEGCDLVLEIDKINPLYTLNLILQSTKSEVLSQVFAMKGVKCLAPAYKSEFVPKGIVATIGNILLEKDTNKELIQESLEALAVACEQQETVNKVVDSKLLPKVMEFLAVAETSASATKCLQAMCRYRQIRSSIDKATLKQLYRIATGTNESMGLNAKSALLALCLEEDKLEYFKNKGWSQSIFSLFRNLKSFESRLKSVEIISQLSDDCLNYSLNDLYESICEPLKSLVNDKSTEIRIKAISALKNLIQRIDLQKHFTESKFVKLLVETYEFLEEPFYKLDTIVCMSVISNNCRKLLEEIEYMNFFLSKVNKQEVTKELLTEETAEQVTKLAKLTCCGMPEQFVQSEMKSKVKFVCSECRSDSEFLRLKAVGALGILSQNYSFRENLIQWGVLEELVLLLKDEFPSVKSQAAKVLSYLTTAPDKLELWLKMDSAYVVDASNLHITEKSLEVKKLRSSEMYSGWGKEFSKGETVVISDFPFLEAWTFFVWFKLPLVKGKFNVLLQGSTRTGAILGVSGNNFVTYDESSGVLVTLWSGVAKLNKGWHNLLVTRSVEGLVTAYIDGEAGKPKSVKILQNMKYFGNDSSGEAPFGTLCDLRVYSRCLSYSEIHSIQKYNSNFVDGLPDKVCEYSNLNDMCNLLADFLREDLDVMKVEALEALGNLATKASCRAGILRSGGLQLIVSSLNSPNRALRFHAARALVNLA